MTLQASVPAVVTAILAATTTAVAGQTSAAGSPVQVIDGELGTYVADEYIQIIGAAGAQALASVGNLWRDEDYTIQGLIRVYVGGDDTAYTRNRAFALLALLEQSLTADRSLGGLLVLPGMAQLGRFDLRNGVTSKGGRASELAFEIDVHNQIRT